MKKKLFPNFLLAVAVVFAACSPKPKSPGVGVDPLLPQLRAAVAAGNYAGALKLSKEIAAKIPASSGLEEALYLQGYLMAYGASDFQGARKPLKKLLDLFPRGPWSLGAQKLIADCWFWDKNYVMAAKEYERMEKDFGVYPSLQKANCLLLREEAGDALTAYRQIAEKNPGDPLADTAQLMVANTYLKVQNVPQAKTELFKLLGTTRNQELQRDIQTAIPQLDEKPRKKEAKSQ